MSLSCTTVKWRGLTLSSAPGSPFGVSNVSGWDELPSARLNAPERAAGHGRFDDDVWSDERVVQVSGQFVSPDRDELLAQMAAELTWPSRASRAEALTITRAGRELTAYARLTAFRTPTGLDWAVGEVPFVIEWRARDPLRYAEPVPASTSFPELVGGLEYDLYTDGAGADLGYLDYGVESTSGRVTVSNPGTADSWAQFEVVGPVDASGFEVVTVGTGARLVFAGAVPSGSRLLLDSATGAVLLDGDADRSGLLTVRDWAPIPAGGSVEFAFVPRGSTSAASLTVTVAPAFW
jgi:hypothetical protein